MGKLIHEKNLKSKILWHCPSNIEQTKPLCFYFLLLYRGQKISPDLFVNTWIFSIKEIRESRACLKCVSLLFLVLEWILLNYSHSYQYKLTATVEIYCILKSKIKVQQKINCKSMLKRGKGAGVQCKRQNGKPKVNCKPKGQRVANQWVHGEVDSVQIV